LRRCSHQLHGAAIAGISHNLSFCWIGHVPREAVEMSGRMNWEARNKEALIRRRGSERIDSNDSAVNAIQTQMVRGETSSQNQQSSKVRRQLAGRGKRPLVTCPKCPSMVREDRLEKHNRRVHKSLQRSDEQPPITADQAKKLCACLREYRERNWGSSTISFGVRTGAV